MTYPPNPQPTSGQQQPYGQPHYGQQPFGQPRYPQPQYPQPQYRPPSPRGASSPEDLSLPLYGATFRQATRRFFKQYANFSGRASLSEYWWSSLLTTIILLVPTLLVTIGAILVGVSAATTAVEQQAQQDGAYDVSMPAMDLGVGMTVLIIGAVLTLIAWVALLVPSLSVSWRRLHDANFPGWYYFVTLVPSVGSIVLLVFMLLPSKAEGQRFDQPAEMLGR